MRTLFSTILVMSLLGWKAFALNEPIIGGPCEGCESVFADLPEELSSSARIAPASEPGEPMVIEGAVFRPDGTAAAGIIVYAYQTNHHGVYPPGKTRHGRLRGWARTDQYGTYHFETIRPGHYPGRESPQHIHMHVIEPGKATYYIDDLIFDDDPLVTPAFLQQHSRGRGGAGLAHPERDDQGVWQARRDIVLGKNIKGYQ